MRLFGRTNEASISRRVGEAEALCERGHLADGRRRLRGLVSEAEEGLGRDHREALFAVEALAMSYAYDEPTKGVQLVEELVPRYKRVFGGGSRELLVLRGHLPGLYGIGGDYEQARDLAAALLPECERVFGADADETREMRLNLRHATDDIAQRELDDQLALTIGPAVDLALSDWQDRVQRAADQHQGASCYRSRLGVRFNEEGDGTGEWRFEYVRPDKLHVLQFITEQGEELADEWIVLGRDCYQNAGLWFKPDEDLNEEVNRFLTSDKYLDLLHDGSAVSAASADAPTGSTYLILTYEDVPQSFREYFSGDEQPAGWGGETRVWIDLADDTLARVDVSLSAQTDTSEKQSVAASQAFTSYNAEIEIDPPQAELVTVDSSGAT
jgi:hypothetical protein